MLKNLHKEKNVKIKNVVFIKKKFKIFCQEEKKTILLVVEKYLHTIKNDELYEGKDFFQKMTTNENEKKYVKY